MTLTIDPIAIMFRCPEARSAELVTCTERARAKLPCLTAREELILEQLVMLPIGRAHHEA